MNRRRLMANEAKLALSFETYNTTAASGNINLYVTYNGKAVAPNAVSYKTSNINVAKQSAYFYLYWNENFSTTNQCTHSITITYKEQSVTAYVIQDVNSIVSEYTYNEIIGFNSDSVLKNMSLTSQQDGGTYTFVYEGDDASTSISCTMRNIYVKKYATGSTTQEEGSFTWSDLITGWHGYLLILTDEPSNMCYINGYINPINDNYNNFYFYSPNLNTSHTGDNRYLAELVDRQQYSSSLMDFENLTTECLTISINNHSASINIYPTP